MARLIGPDDGQRGTQRPGGHDAARGASVVVYANSTGSTLADILTEAGGAVPGSTLTTDTTYGFIPKFQFPDGVDTVYVEVAGGPRTEVNARYEARVDALSARVAALEVGTQVLDGDLTVIAGLDSATAGVLASDGAGWIRKSYSAVKTALGLVKGDVGLGNVDNTSDANKPVSTATAAAISALSGTYAPLYSGRPGNRWVALGDSTTEWNDSAPAGWQRNSWVDYAAALSGQQLHLVKNAGKGGNTTAQMLARFDTDVTPYAPSLVTILGGRNDSTLADTIAGITALVAKVRGIGAMPVLATITPSNTAPLHPIDQARNTWIRRYAEAHGLPVLPFAGALTDPANGNWLAAYYNDGSHPNDAGFMLMAQIAVATLGPLLPSWRPHLSTDNTDSQNLVTNGLFLSATAGLPDSWAHPAVAPNASLITSDPNISGNWYRVPVSGSGVTAQVPASGTVPLIAGHLYAFAGRFKIEPGAAFSGSTAFEVVLAQNDGGGTQVRPVSDWAAPVASGVFYEEFTPASGATTGQVVFNVGAGTAAVQVAQVTLYDLTAMAVL